jgi:hypothetical protein
VSSGPERDNGLCFYLLVLLPDTYEARSNETRSGIVLIKQVETLKVSLRGRWGGHNIDWPMMEPFHTELLGCCCRNHDAAVIMWNTVQDHTRPILRMTITGVPCGSYLLNKSVHRWQLPFPVLYLTIIFIFH